LLMLYNTLHLRPIFRQTVSLALFHRTADATICHGNNLNCFSVNSTVLNDFLLTGGTDYYRLITAFFLVVFTAQCTLVHMRGLVLGSHVVRLSVCLSVRPSVCDVGDL